MNIGASPGSKGTFQLSWIRKTVFFEAPLTSLTMKQTYFSIILSVILVGLCSCAAFQEAGAGSPESGDPFKRPRLIVGIVVDQMKPDYIYRFWEDFSEGGFKRLVNDGFFAANLHYNYMPTYTGPGHAAVYTGTTPAYHGIVANDWYVRDSDYVQYCARDTTSRGVGSESKAAQMSPIHLRTTTMGDELRIFSNFQSKVIGIALKDRGAILPAGRMANAAYWYIGGNEDVWATSDWYGMEALPGWVKEFNSKGLGDAYLKQGWSLMLPEERYEGSGPDNNPYETPFRGSLRPVFPYDLNALREANKNFDLIKATPWGNTLTTEFAKAALRGEDMGKRGVTDMLCLSYSATDYVGHQFGMHSMEIQDAYVRLDRDLAGFLKFLDEWVGKGEYLVFLTADHGGAPTPSYLAKYKSSASYFKSETLESLVEDYLNEKYGARKWLLHESNQNIFLDHAIVKEAGLNITDLQREVARFILRIDGVADAFTSEDLMGQETRGIVGSRVQLGFHQRLSGDVIYNLLPGWLEYGMTGTTHGSPYTYDTHVPALFYGFGVKPGESWKPQTICDIAPTVAALCHLPLPNACIGEPVKGLVK